MDVVPWSIAATTRSVMAAPAPRQRRSGRRRGAATPGPRPCRRLAGRGAAHQLEHPRPQLPAQPEELLDRPDHSDAPQPPARRWPAAAQPPRLLPSRTRRGRSPSRGDGPTARWASSAATVVHVRPVHRWRSSSRPAAWPPARTRAGTCPAPWRAAAAPRPSGSAAATRPAGTRGGRAGPSRRHDARSHGLPGAPGQRIGPVHRAGPQVVRVPSTAVELAQRQAELVAGGVQVLLDEPDLAQRADDAVCGGPREVEGRCNLLQPERPVRAAEQPQHRRGPLDGLDEPRHGPTVRRVDQANDAQRRALHDGAPYGRPGG